MKKCKQLISFLLSIFIVVSAFLNSYFISYANENSSNEGDSLADKIGKDIAKGFEETAVGYSFVVSQLGAFFSGDFQSFLQNNTDLKEYYGITSSDFDNNFENYITINQYTQEVTFSEDFVSYIKQALKEYSEETNGYYIIPTMSLDSMSPTDFVYKTSYTTMYNIVKECGMVGVYGYSRYNSSIKANKSYYYIVNLSDFQKNGDEFVLNSKFASNFDISSSSAIGCNIYNADWQCNFYGYYYYEYDGTDPVNGVYQSINDMTYKEYEKPSSSYYQYYPYIFLFRNYNNTSFKESGAIASYLGDNYFNVVTPHGDRVRFFKDLTALKYYSVNKRTVYFGSDFYDKEPAEITVSFDDLEKYLNTDYTDYFKKISDQIAEQGGNLSESDIEKIIDSILNGMKDIQGGIDDVNNSVNNLGPKLDEQLNILQKIYAKLSDLDAKVGRILSDMGNNISGAVGIDLTTVEDYLSSINESLKSIKNWTVVDTVVDGADAIADWIDLIHDVLSDVDNGAESAVATLSSALDDGAQLLKSKFPFSIPWDIFFFVTLLAAEPEVPYFEVPINFDVSALDMHIDYLFVVDFAQYQYLSDILRTILSMTYCVGLIKMTSGVVNIKKEE